jgi:predicted metallo-beta-lactamase superfamily hydrolase
MTDITSANLKRPSKNREKKTPWTQTIIDTTNSKTIVIAKNAVGSPDWAEPATSMPSEAAKRGTKVKYRRPIPITTPKPVATFEQTL